MKALTKSILFAAAITMSAGSMAAEEANTAPQTLDQLLQTVKQARSQENKENRQREAEFRADRADKQALLRQAKAKLAAAQKHGAELQQQFQKNETRIANKEQELDTAKGTLGEMFGVVRQAANEATGKISSSIVSAQYPGRTQLLESLSEAKELPTIKELRDLWIALQTEMTESGKVVKFNTQVVGLDGTKHDEDVVRVGTFDLIGPEGYLQYNPETKTVQPLGRQPAGHIVGAAQDFLSETSGFAPLYLDPSRGQILGLLTQKATMTERYQQGGLVGYIITGVLALGLLIALERFITLGVMGSKIRSQLKHTENPSEGNPLGRILKVYQSNKNVDVETLELKLDEAVMHETPRIERGVNVIKILAAIAPLLGLLGTVTGMIGTFQAITLFGTGDPKIMAGDISMALVTTAQGLIAALPLVLIHSVVSGRSRSLLHILDEQSAGIIAEHAEKEKA